VRICARARAIRKRIVADGELEIESPRERERIIDGREERRMEKKKEEERRGREKG